MSRPFNCPNEPNPARLIESLRHLGYDNYIAIADIVDNSIDADAEMISIRVFRENGSPRIIIADNGTGMDRETLDQAMRLGSLTIKNPVADLGKFGMGLVTASLSIAREATVITRRDSQSFTSINDVDQVVRTNRFDKHLGESTADERSLLDTLIGVDKPGTAVILDNCDGLKNTNTTNFASTLRSRLGRIHRYFLRAHTQILVNDEETRVVDPLELDDPQTETFSDEEYPISMRTPEGERTVNVRVRIVLIPEKPAAGEWDVAVSQQAQGFDVLRNNRVIQFSQTLDAFTKHNDFNRMRGEVFLSGDLDSCAGIDFTKRGIVLEQSFKDQLLRNLKAQCTTIKARESGRTRVKENPEVDGLHREAQRAIDQKAKLLLTPKTMIEKRSERTEHPDKEPEPKDTGTRRKFRLTQVAAAERCRFEYALLSSTGPIYDCELVGKIIVIRWNLQHPFYQRFVLDQRSDGRLVTAIDFLIYSMASAELMMLSDENTEMMHKLRQIISMNMRTLLT